MEPKSLALGFAGSLLLGGMAFGLVATANAQNQPEPAAPTSVTATPVATPSTTPEPVVTTAAPEPTATTEPVIEPAPAEPAPAPVVVEPVAPAPAPVVVEPAPVVVEPAPVTYDTNAGEVPPPLDVPLPPAQQQAEPIAPPAPRPPAADPGPGK